MDLHDYLKQHSASALAQAVGAHGPTVYQWAAKKRSVPARYCPAIEVATGGLVSRAALRPDDWRLIWPDWVDPAASPGHPGSAASRS